MSPLTRRLRQALQTIDRPGSFCVSGSAPAVLPGLEVTGLGPIGLPLTAKQAKELKKQCEQAPYGKGEQTVVDTKVRRVWRLKPERFALTNPDWQPFLRQTVQQVQQELGLEKQELESHLYDLLLYEPGSFFLPHRDGEKLARMVATLVIVLPSSFAGGELVVRHDDQERIIDFCGGDSDQFRTHFAAFYADCEHEIRPLREGHRLCLVYNLTLKKAKQAIGAPRNSEAIAAIAQVLRDWSEKGTPRKLAVTLDHQYTRDGLVWDALKGLDQARANVLLEAARQTDCHAYLALLTLHESGSSEGGGYDGSGYSRWDDEGDDEDEDDDEGEEEAQSGKYTMDEVFDSDLTAEGWSDAAGNRPPFGSIAVEEDELLDPKALRAVKPEEEYEGFTGNEGMTLDRWYRRAALVLWPQRHHFAVLCDASTASAIQALEPMVRQWQQAGKKDAAVLHAACVDFAATIIAHWQASHPAFDFGRPENKPDALLPLLAELGEAKLVKAYLGTMLVRDRAVDPGELLPKVCQQFGWETLRPELEAVCKSTTVATLERNVRLLELLCLAKPRKQSEWLGVCKALARETVLALERLDAEKQPVHYWPAKSERSAVLAGLVRALLVTGQPDLLDRLITHTLALPKKYPLTAAHVAALTTLGPWFKKNVKQPCPPLARWLDACREQFEDLTATTPQPPADFRRSATIACKCPECTALKQFLQNPQEKVHRLRAKEDRRRHLADTIRHAHCDLDCTTDRSGSPHTLVCTKNTASYQAKLKKFHEDQEHLATLHSIQASLPGSNQLKRSKKHS